MNTGTLVISGEDVAHIAQNLGVDTLMDELIARIDMAFSQFDEGAFEIPARSGFHYTTPEVGLTEWMPLLDHEGRIFMKAVGYHPTNPDLRELPTILSTLSMYNKESGSLEAIMDGTIATAMRTGAASAIASKLMAKPDSRTLGLIGCGAQAVTQWHALSRLFDFDEVLFYDIDPQAARSLTDRVAGLGLTADRIESCELATVVGEADILCIATSVDVGSGPVFSPELETKPWLHINAVGSDFPGKIEIPRDLLRKSFVSPDFHNQARKEGECQQLGSSEIGPEIVMIAKTPDAFGDLANQRTIFDSTGYSLEDYVAMTMLREFADRFELGVVLNIESAPSDPRNPYPFLFDRPPIPATNTEDLPFTATGS